MSDDTIEVESCWTGEAGARKCLNQALHLVGLNDGPLGDLGVEIMVGEKQKIAKEHKVIAPDCVGLPLMQKISKQHKVIASDCVGWLLKQKISKQHKVATQELHENCTRCAPALHAHAHNGAPPFFLQLATKSCSTDHTAIFKRLADGNVEIVGHGI